jgi:polyhydroxybutyrate depolymerase
MMTVMRSRALTAVLSTLVVVVALSIGPAAATGHAGKAGSGCNRAAAPGTTTQMLSVEGTERRYLLSVPASYDPAKRAPLVLDFHGLGSNKEQEALYSGMSQKAGTEGYVVITPDGTGDALKHWSFPPLPGVTADVTFVKQLLASTMRTLCIDAKRVYATGMSNGAIFSTMLACMLPGRFAAIAPVAGVNGTRVCSPGTPPTPVLAFHGTADPIVPYAGGSYGAGANQVAAVGSTATAAARARRPTPLRARPVDDAVAKWAAFDGCGTDPTTTQVAADVEHVTYPGCPSKGTVELYRVVGGGHTWPGSFPVQVAVLGRTTSSIDATALILQFFAAHPRGGGRRPPAPAGVR